MENKLPLAMVIWNDAWVRADDPVTLDEVGTAHKPEVIHTLGWILKDDGVGISLVNEFYDGVYRGRTFIPRGMVVSVTPYKLVKPRAQKASDDTIVWGN